MNVFSDFRQADKSNNWKVGLRIFFLLFALAFAGACGKTKVTSPPAVSASPTNSTAAVSSTPATTPTAVETAPANAPDPDKMQPTMNMGKPSSDLTQLQVLNRALVGWEMKNHRHPRTFEEFAGSVGVSIPAPPAGQKYAFNGKGFIVLVNSNQ